MCGYVWSSGGGGRRGARLWTLLWIAVPEAGVHGDRAQRETARGRSKLVWAYGFLRRVLAPGSTGICRAGAGLRVFVVV